MNKIEIKNHLISSGYETRVFFIDDKPLYEYFNEWFENQANLACLVKTSY